MKEESTLALLARYADLCRTALDPDERSKCISEWMAKLPANQQRLINDFAPHAAAIAKKIQERRVPRV